MKNMSNNDIINFAKNVIETEINGLKDLQYNLDDNFVKTCHLLHQIKGKIICCGIGKSGHIANKISATLASTGTPAFFVHPTEALHGDLGMISTNDAILAISNSGNTIELSGIINYAVRFNIPLIGITQNKNSKLGVNSTHLLLLPQSPEACSLGLAPTTSTTNSLALGDCLAITLLHMKGFKEEDFKIFHPGGSLGNKLISIENVMHKDIPIINQEHTMSEAIVEVTKHKFGCIAICNQENKMIGIITDGDIRRHMDDNFLNKNVIEVMNKNFIHINANENTSKVLSLMQKNKISNVFVLNNNNQPIGIIHIHDLLSLGVV